MHEIARNSRFVVGEGGEEGKRTLAISCISAARDFGAFLSQALRNERERERETPLRAQSPQNAASIKREKELKELSRSVASFWSARKETRRARGQEPQRLARRGGRRHAHSARRRARRALERERRRTLLLGVPDRRAHEDARELEAETRVAAQRHLRVHVGRLYFVWTYATVFYRNQESRARNEPLERHASTHVPGGDVSALIVLRERESTRQRRVLFFSKNETPAFSDTARAAARGSPTGPACPPAEPAAGAPEGGDFPFLTSPYLSLSLFISISLSQLRDRSLRALFMSEA